jgi:hypothetical protein
VVLFVVSLSTLGLAGCARQEAPPTPAASVAPAEQAADKAAIRQVLHGYMEAKGLGSAPEENVRLAQVSIDSGYALVSWTHEGEGGQAVLQQRAGAWQVMECGSGWLGLQGVCKEDVPVEVAKRLLDQIDPNWPAYETY